MKIDKINFDGKKNSIEVLDKIFAGKINKKLVANVLYKTNTNYKGRKSKTKQNTIILYTIVDKDLAKYLAVETEALTTMPCILPKSLPDGIGKTARPFRPLPFQTPATYHAFLMILAMTQFSRAI